MTGNTLRIGIPKGSLEEATLALFHRVGLQFTGSSRSLWLSSNDPEIVPVLLRPQEIPIYVESGRLDAGLAGLDWIVERDVEQKIVLLANLQYSKQTSRPIRWVLAVPNQMPVEDVDDLRALCEERGIRGDRQFTIATELTRVSNMWLARNGVDASAEFSWGATEAKAGYFADAVIEATETGSSLRANGLRIVAEVFTSTTRLFANKDAYRHDPWKNEKLDAIGHLLVGALRADDLVQLTVVGDHELNLQEALPSDARVVTSISPTNYSPFHAVVTLRKASVPRALPALIAQGASDAWISTLDIYYSREAGPSAAVHRDQVSDGSLSAMGDATGRVSLEWLSSSDTDDDSTLTRDVLAGFAKNPKEIPPKYLYAIGGSDIFEKITELPEYYVARAEMEALRIAAREIAGSGDWSRLVELGPGSGKKTRYLLEPMLLRRDMIYEPVDISERALSGMANELVGDYRGLRVRGFVGDFLGSGLERVLEDGERKLVAFLGSTIGNLTSSQRQELFGSFAVHALPGDGFLIGVDLVKDPAVIEAAYNDAAGVTADFNKNVLRVLQRDLGARLDPEDFQHKAVYLASEHCIEMRLYAGSDLVITFRDARLPDYGMSAGDYLLTELSYKFTRESIESELSGAGLQLIGWWTDPGGQVALALGGRKS